LLLLIVGALEGDDKIFQMDEHRYDPSNDFDDHDFYRDSEVTGVGLPPGQLALIIGVNAVISLIISVVVVLIASRQVFPGDITMPAAGADAVATEENQANDLPNIDPGDTEQASLPESTPIQSVTYVVEAGDTLGLIAQKFSVSLYDLMIINGLVDENFVQVGQELIIPLSGLPTVTPTFTPVTIPTNTPLPFDPPTPLPQDAAIPPEPAATVGPSPTPLPTNTPTTTVTAVPLPPTPLPTSTPPPFDEVNVVINNVNGTGDLLRETLIILNQGAGVSLNEWKLEGSSLGIFIFPDIFLFSGGSIQIHTTAGQNTPSDLYLNQSEPAWPPGTTIVLVDASGKQVSNFTVP
jgi:LysM repeat protein